ncbi:MAG: hypothetical protein SVV80_14245 [Planctomycetota bacterium]|nr:hypothetical protein [Planctomycetota bacterium]
MKPKTRSYTVEKRCGMPVYVEARRLPDLPDRPSQINDKDVPPGKILRAGTSRVDVTPSEPSKATKSGGFLHMPPTGVHDRLYVRALVLDNGQERLAIISWDKINVCGFNEVARIRREINKRTGIPPGNILIGATHTHAGCDAAFSEASIKAVTQAWEGMKKARIGVGSRMIYGIGASRRMPDGTGLWNANQPNPHGVMDNECGVIRVEDEKRNIIAVVVNYSAHPSVIAGGNSLISGDYPGIGMQEIEKRLGGGALALFLQGCAGDTGTQAFRKSRTIPEAERLGKKLADEAMGILKNIDVTGWMELDGKNRMILLPQKKHDPTRRRSPKTIEGRNHIRDEIQALIIGDLLIFVLGSMEPYVEIGLMIKDASPFKHTFVLGYANGPWLGYVPTPHGYAINDPEARQTPFTPETPKVLITESLKLIGEMKPPKK